MSTSPDYKKNLEKWAARVGATTTFANKLCDVYDLGVKTGTATFVTLTCSIVHGAMSERLQDGETVRECEQRLAQRFLKTFAGTPLGRVQ